MPPGRGYGSMFDEGNTTAAGSSLGDVSHGVKIHRSAEDTGTSGQSRGDVSQEAVQPAVAWGKQQLAPLVGQPPQCHVALMPADVRGTSSSRGTSCAWES